MSPNAMLNRFRPKVRPRSRKNMIEYLVGHFRYNTMNSWNRSTSYAHKIKLHNLQFPSKEVESRAWDIIGCEDVDGAFDGINQLILEFTDSQSGCYTAGFNGRSGGYLVLYRSERRPSQHTHRCNGCGHRAYGAAAYGHNFGGCQGEHVPHTFQPELATYPGKDIDMYEDFSSWDTSSLRDRVDLVWAFDQLAEECVAEFIYFCESHHVEEVEVTTTRKVSTAVEDSGEEHHA
jgi:hypothetical protein